jgi:hypothetical protein
VLVIQKLVKNFLLLIFLLSFSLGCTAQFDETPVKELTFRERLFWGGNLGMNFGNITFIDISPLLGYRLTDRLVIGPGITYMYYRENFPPWPIFETSIYGGRIFGRYFFTSSLFSHGEYEVLNIGVVNRITNMPERSNITNLIAGGGFRRPMGGRGFFNVMVLFNLSNNNFYQNPIIRGGFGFGF